MPSFALGLLVNQPPQYQNQYTLVNKNGRLRFAAVSRRVLALPNEILGEIFVYCLREPEPDGHPFGVLSKLDPNDAPLVLCAVCRRWRDIALTTPGLWGSFSIQQTSVLSDSGADYVEFCRTWLSRAGITPVSIEFEAWIEHKRVLSLLEVIGGLAQRWQRAWLTFDPDLLKALRLPEAGKFPFLEQLALGTSFSELSLSFCDAPRLRDVYLVESTPQIRLPWHQLTSYETCTVLVPHFLQILGDAPNLVDARFGIGGTFLPPSLPSIVIPLLHLQVLKLGNSDDDFLPMTILNCLKAPALEDLTLSFHGAQAFNANALPFLSFVSRSSFRLHILALSLMPGSTEGLIECLKATPTVADLKLRVRLGTNVNDVLAPFTGRSDNFLPKLESFHFVFSNQGVLVTTETASLVIDMLCWRWSMVGSTQLRSFNLDHEYFGLGNSLKSHPEYRRLRREGMLLYVEPGGYHYRHADSFML
ncbi:F-box domain-containing protein [Mycena sanguinolenta]|uniref:F-box domain-containing protein n=1 Tax=Mycena sanguinolenta TaxID=230812 RepID=A0A8H7D9H9_9AGAR|nr:F-box domain-containing protein [Mycena sanguinolenta]